jgi:hypothetical protein
MKPGGPERAESHHAGDRHGPRSTTSTNSQGGGRACSRVPRGTRHLGSGGKPIASAPAHGGEPGRSAPVAGRGAALSAAGPPDCDPEQSGRPALGPAPKPPLAALHGANDERAERLGVSRRAAPGRPVGTGEEGQDESVPARPVQRRPASNGAAKRFGVRLDLVHAWIKRGLVKGERHDFQAHRRVWWLEIAEDTAARLERLAAALRRA